MNKHRQNFPDADKFPQQQSDALTELALALGMVIGAGTFGAMLAYVVWGLK